MRLGKTERVALQVVGAVGLIALVAIAPGMGLVFKQFGIDKKFDLGYVPNIISRLRRKKYIEIKIENGRKHARLTQLGRKRLDEYARITKFMQHPKQWDGKWRLVTFDIAEKFRRTRDHVRFELKEAGFIQLHKSVWVTPHPCEEFIALLKADHRIGHGLLYIEADKIEYSGSLRKKFNL